MNRYIIGNSSSGKTRKLLETATSVDAIVVCQNPDAMRVKAQNYGIYRLDFCGYDEIQYYAHLKRPIVIDEIGNFFKCNYGVPLEGFNLTAEV